MLFAKHGYNALVRPFPEVHPPNCLQDYISPAQTGAVSIQRKLLNPINLCLYANTIQPHLLSRNTALICSMQLNRELTLLLETIGAKRFSRRFTRIVCIKILSSSSSRFSLSSRFRSIFIW